MRDGLDAPTFELSAEKVAEIRAYLDGQSRFKLAVWVRHEQRGVDGPLYDHHLVLAVDDEDWANGDMRALEEGMRFPALDATEKTWIDIYPASEFDELRSFGIVLWEQTSPGADPLDYRFTHERVAISAEALKAFGSLVQAVAPEVVRVTATRSRFVEGQFRGRGLYVALRRLRLRAHVTSRAARSRAEGGTRGGYRSLGRVARPLGRAAGLRDGYLRGRGSRMSLEMRDHCERCGIGLEQAAGDALICSYECTFCRSCAEAMDFVFPNCSGELVARPKRVAA
jgi:hypothetical protein